MMMIIIMIMKVKMTMMIIMIMTTKMMMMIDEDQVNPSSHDTLEMPTHPSTRAADPLVQQQTMEDLTSKAESVNVDVGNAVILAGLTNWADDVFAKVQKQQDGTRSLLSQAVAYVKSLKQECVSKFDAVIQSLESKLCAFEKDPSTIATKEQPQVDLVSKVVPQTVPEAIDDLLEERNVKYHSPPVKRRRVLHVDTMNGSNANKEQNVLSPSESRDTSVAEISNTKVVVNHGDTFKNRKGMLMGDGDVQQHDNDDKTMMDVSESTTNGESVSKSDKIPAKVVMEEGPRSNATKESINEDNPLSEVVINVEYHSKEQSQVESLTKVVPQTIPKAIDDSLQEERNVKYHSPPVKRRRVLHADIVNGFNANKEQNVRSPSESRDTIEAEVSNTKVVVSHGDTFKNRKGVLMGDGDGHDNDGKTMMDVSESTTNGESLSKSDKIPPKVVMEEGPRSNGTKESINEDNPLSEMVINVEYYSKEQSQVDSLTKVVPQTIPKAIDDSPQGLGKKQRKGRKQRKIFTLCESVPAPTPSSTPASINRPVSPTRLLEPSEAAMPYGRMRGGLEDKKLEAARLELLAPPRQPVDAIDPWSISAPTVPLEVLMKQFPIQ